MKRIQTQDGSHTLYHENIQDHYHSVFGAIQESRHVFIEQGLLQTHGSDLSIYEVGLGTGLNVLLTYAAALERKLHILYHAIEKYPLDKPTISTLNYSRLLHNEGIPVHFLDAVHDAPWDKPVELSAHFILHKIKADFNTYVADFNFDLVYFDAFAPEKQPDIWNLQNFQKLFMNLHPGGSLVTYCAKGQVKKKLRESGFGIERLPGPPGKRHMLRALKP